MATLSDLNGTFLSIQSRLVKLVSQIVPPKDIEDIVQETYVRVCQVESPERINCPKSFLFRTAKNLALDHVKRSEHKLVGGVESEEEYDVSLEKDQSGPYSQAVSNAEFSEFCEAVRQLPVQCRKVFVLKKVYGYSQREIASTLGIAQSTVEKHISTGVKKCYAYMLMTRSFDYNVSGSLSGSDVVRKKK